MEELYLYDYERLIKLVKYERDRAEEDESPLIANELKKLQIKLINLKLEAERRLKPNA